MFAASPRLTPWDKALTCFDEHWPEPESRRQVATSAVVVFVTWSAH
jgi:hypothetical protein